MAALSVRNEKETSGLSKYRILALFLIKGIAGKENYWSQSILICETGEGEIKVIFIEYIEGKYRMVS